MQMVQQSYHMQMVQQSHHMQVPTLADGAAVSPHAGSNTCPSACSILAVKGMIGLRRDHLLPAEHIEVRLAKLGESSKDFKAGTGDYDRSQQVKNPKEHNLLCHF